MQPFEEALRDGLKPCLNRTEHPLAVGGDHICSVSGYPVEAVAASYYVLARRPVEDE
jgi:hypothetical protein